MSGALHRAWPVGVLSCDLDVTKEQAAGRARHRDAELALGPRLLGHGSQERRTGRKEP